MVDCNIVGSQLKCVPSFLYLIYIQTFFIGIVPTKAITGTIPGNEEGVSGLGKLLFINPVSVLYFLNSVFIENYQIVSIFCNISDYIYVVNMLFRKNK